MTTVSQTQLATNTIHKTTLMHLSIIVSPSNPMQGWVGITGDSPMYLREILHFWGSFLCLQVHACTDHISYQKPRCTNIGCPYVLQKPGACINRVWKHIIIEFTMYTLIHTQTRMYIHTYAYTQTAHTHTHIRACKHVYVASYVCVCVCVHVRMCICVRVYVYTVYALKVY